MADAPSRTPLAGSSRSAPAHPRVGEPSPDAEITVTAYLRGPQTGPGRLSREEYAATQGPAAGDVEAVRRFASAHGLAVGEVDRGRRSVELVGTTSAMQNAFGTRLGLYQGPAGATYRGREGELSLPSELGGIITGVFGLDDRPQAHPHFRPRAGASTQYTPPQVAEAYDYPGGVTAAGECVALIELGGGFREADLSAYFASLGIPLPAVQAVSVLKAKNSPGQADGPDGEVMLDIEVLGGVAPGARIAVYFAPNTDQGFIDAVTTAVHDASRKPSVVSISWGSAESTWTAAAMQQMEEAFAAAAAMGVTVTVAAGDNGSGDGVTDGLAHVDFPASAPHALACGGTRLEMAAGRITAETVWDDGQAGGAGGGGISVVFPVPAYQQEAGPRCRPTRAAKAGGACPISAAMPTRVPVTPCGSTAKP